MAFPSSPSNGQIYKEYIYNSTTQAWESSLDEQIAYIEDKSDNLYNSAKSTGIIIPMYIYPADIYNNTTYNDLIDLIKSDTSVPYIVILNPSNGPGVPQDGNYTAAIKRLQGAGANVIGYVSTDYTNNSILSVKTDIDKWLEIYSGITGIFFDEMTSDDNQTHFDYYKELNEYAASYSLGITVANPGVAFDKGYYDNDCADIIIGWENSSYPSLVQAKEDWAGGAADYPITKRGAMIYNQPSFNLTETIQLKKYYGWIYITDGDTGSPWDTVSTYLDTVQDNLKSKGSATLDADGTLSANSDLIGSTQKAIKTYSDTKLALSGGNITGSLSVSSNSVLTTATIDTTETLGTSETLVPSQDAVKKYVDGQITSHDSEHDDRFLQLSGGTLTNKLTGTEIWTTSNNGFRLKQSNYSSIFRNDNGSLWLLLTDSGDPDGTYNSLRPLKVEFSTGDVTINSTLKVAAALTTSTQDIYLPTGNDLIIGSFTIHYNSSTDELEFNHS